MRKFSIKKVTALGILAAAMLGMTGVEAMATSTDGTAADLAVAAEVPVEKPMPAEYGHITSCVIEDGNRIAIRGEVKGTWSDPAFYDNYLYLFELKPYQDDLTGRTDYCGWITKGDALSFDLDLKLGSKDDRLYSRFVMAVYDGSSYIPTGNVVYITNPESLASHTENYRNAQNKKGLLIQNTTSMVADAFELGVNHVIVNIPFHHILGEGIDYVYDGKTYHFNKSLLEEYDSTIRRMSEKSMTVTAVILNGWNDNTPQLIYPGVTRQPENQVFYYGFNASTEEGYETIKAIASFLADRYSSLKSPYGKVSNWIIGNEINNQQWNYMGSMSLEQYTREYERAFRVFYTAIKSTNQNDRLFFSTDFNWRSDANGTTKYNAKDIIDTFNSNVVAGGQMDWNLAYHPYSIPMTEPEFWDDDQTGLITYDAASPVVNLKNLSVLTDYLQQAHLRNSKGEVRHVILSEQGFTSKSLTRGENNDLQAAAIAYAYYIADSNPYIDAFIMSRQVDAPVEVDTSCMFGLWYCDMNQPNDIVPTMRKKSWTIYKNIDNRNTTLATTEFAKSIIGIDKWSDVIPNFKWRSQEK